METNQKEWTASPLFVKAVIIAVIAALLLLPAHLIQQIIDEREESWNAAVAEVSNKWANPQTVTGPIVSVPYSTAPLVPTTGSAEGYLHIMPEKLSISGVVEPEQRHRGIYDVMLYKTSLHVSGQFGPPDLLGSLPAGAQLRWNESIVSVGISDMRGINDPIEIRLGERTLQTQPGVRQTDVVQSGVAAQTSLVRDSIGSFAFDLNLNGSSELNFVPVGKSTTVDLVSTWSHPSFAGSFLPDTHSIKSDGFRAQWSILDVNRNFPQAWSGRAFRPQSSAFGLELFTPVDTYQKNWRATRYAALFIVLTFLIYFFAEARVGSKVHPIQYGLVGVALCIFYLLLLSVSEHVRFEIAYLIASAAIVTLLTAFTIVAFRGWKQPLLLFSSLAILYGFLYSLLQINDYALLIGSVGLFIVTSAFLMLSGSVKWYANRKA
jgi:inner membrane protein